jgi:hypothetical protein
MSTPLFEGETTSRADDDLLVNSYLIAQQVVYLCICEKSYPRKLAFSYLDELSKEFQTNYGDQIDKATRPYAMRGFGECWPVGMARMDQ